MLILLLVLLLWDSYRIVSIVVIAGAFLGLGIFTAIRVRNLAEGRPRLLSTSLDQLSKDKEQVTPR
jgi:uncharacterized membrane protein YqjE